MRDWELYSPAVRDGGLVVFHDADAERGVRRAVARLAGSSQDTVSRWVYLRGGPMDPERSTLRRAPKGMAIAVMRQSDKRCGGDVAT